MFGRSGLANSIPANFQSPAIITQAGRFEPRILQDLRREASEDYPGCKVEKTAQIYSAAPAVLLALASCGGDLSNSDIIPAAAPTNAVADPVSDPLGPGAAPIAPVEPAATAPEQTPPVVPVVPEEVDGCGPTIAPRVRRLSPSQFDNTVRTFIPNLNDSPSQGFLSSLTLTSRFRGAAGSLNMSTGQVGQLLDVGEDLALQLVEEPEFLAPCMATPEPDAACVSTFATELLTRAFRRPPGADLDRYMLFYADSTAQFGQKNALELLVRRVLLEPEFLYRFELGGPDGSLTPYELASSLSYLVSDAPPDAELMAAAASGQLVQQDVLLDHAQRLLDTRETGAGLEAFFEQNFHYSGVKSVNKDEELFPAFGPELAEAMAAETREFIAHVLWQDDGKLSTLYSAPYSMLNEPLAALYGVEGGMGEEFVPVDLPPEQRGGLVTQPSFMAIESDNLGTRLVERGLFVTEEFLCIEVPEPPPGVADAVIEIDESMPLTQRERLTQHSTEPQCAGCHSLFDPFAFPLEQLDAIGAFRTEDNGLPIDPTAELLSLGGQVVSNAGELARAVADSAQAKSCLAERLHEYAFGGHHEGSQCEITAMSESLTATDGDIRQAVLEAIAMPNFSRRAPNAGTL